MLKFVVLAIFAYGAIIGIDLGSELIKVGYS